MKKKTKMMLMMSTLRRALSSIDISTTTTNCNNNSNNSTTNSSQQLQANYQQHFQQQNDYHQHEDKSHFLTTSTSATTMFTSKEQRANNKSRSCSKMEKELNSEYIKKLLEQLYLRGPETVGIFRKSPNAKHCRELKRKLDTNALDCPLEQYQVVVIASVFKEWLRSLPDCLLTSRLYPQWIDVAKLIEPLHVHQQQQQEQQHNSIIRAPSSDDSTSSSHYSCYTMESGNKSREQPTSLRPTRSLLTDNSQLPDRARSCSTMMSGFTSINNNNCIDKGNVSYDDVFHNSDNVCSKSKNEVIGRTMSHSTDITGATNSQSVKSHQNISDFALSERRSECIRLIRQLLATLRESNLNLIRSTICILWHIAKNSESNMMSANNLGVCVGQSLLNDEHQSNSGFSFFNNNKSNSSTFTKRHRRAKSQSLLSSTLSLTSSASLSQTNGIMSNMNASTCYLNSNGAQETAKYVPMLVAFMIENAAAIFGKDIITIFSASDEASIKGQQEHHQLQQQQNASEGIIHESSSDSTLKVNSKPGHPNHGSFDGVDHASANVSNDEGVVIASSSSSDDEAPVKTKKSPAHSHNPMLRQIVVENCDRFKSFPSANLSSSLASNGSDIDNIYRNCSLDCNSNLNDMTPNDGLTSILIVNSPTRQQHRSMQNSTPITEETQRRPLSTTESTSSSRASSSTSGVHSESQVFSSEVDSTHNTRSTSLSPSSVMSPSSVSSPSVSSSESPVQEDSIHSEEYDRPETYRVVDQHSTQAQKSESNVNNQNINHDFSPDLSTCPRSLLVASTSSPVNSLSMSRYPNRQMINRYSTYVNVLNRVPKIPVHFATSNYGGETIIYNPNPNLYQSSMPQIGVYSTIQRLQPPRISRFSPNQFNGLYVKSANTNSLPQDACNPMAHNYNTVLMRKQQLFQHVNPNAPFKSFNNLSLDHSSDESDESSEDWGGESTMV